VGRLRKGAIYRPYRPNRPKAKRSKGLRADGVSFVPSTYRPTYGGNAGNSRVRTWTNRYFARLFSTSTALEKAAVWRWLYFAKKFGETAFMQAIRDSYERFGQQKPIVIASDGQVIAGNGQLAAAADPPQADSRTDRMHDCMKKGS